MNVSLTPELEKLVKRKVESGLYNSASEVLREALRLMDERDRIQEMKMAELRKEVQLGIDSLEKGETREGKQVFANLREKIEAINQV
jgi:antitoxin ParD1/3/4